MEQDQKEPHVKYDRQIRLWGVHGQKILIESKICLLSCEPAGVETVKNLILPGVGSITIVDHNQVQDRDLGNNFFVTEEDIGKNRCDAVTKWLLELNPDVRGEAVNENPAHLIDNNPEFFKKFDLIISNDLSENYIKKIGEICANWHISLIVLRSAGLIGSVRVYDAVHTIIEGKSDRDLDGYRIHSPFPELKEFADSIQLDKLDDFQHRHVPYFVLLIKFLDEWRSSHDGKIPQNFQEKQEFAARIKAKSRDWNEEENFQEAVKFAHKAFLNPSNLPANVEKVFSSDFLKKIDENSDSFWILADALKRFYEKHQLLPVRSIVPDMTSDTDNYLKLKKIYEKKAEEDRKEIQSLIQLSNHKITDEEIKTFCDNLFNLDYIAYRTISQEFDSPKELEVFETDCYKWHFALRAVSQFYDKYQRYPSEVHIQP